MMPSVAETKRERKRKELQSFVGSISSGELSRDRWHAARIRAAFDNQVGVVVGVVVVLSPVPARTRLASHTIHQWRNDG